ncbi:hypothetical protein D9M73_181840 [compost metagenome]
MRKAIEQALAAGLEEALDCRRVGCAVGRGHGFGHQVDDEVTATDVLVRQVAGIDPVVQFFTPGKVGLQVAAIKRVLAPGRVIEATVVALRLQGRLAEDHVLEFQAEMRDMLGTVQRLANGLAQHHSRRCEQILTAQADHRVQAQCVFRGLALQVIVVLVTHLRRSVVLRRVPACCARYTDECPVLLLG